MNIQNSVVMIHAVEAKTKVMIYDIVTDPDLIW